MKIQDIYNQKKNNFLFGDSNEFNKLRENIIKNFDLSLKNKKNNESIQHIDPIAFVSSYNYNNVSDDINYINIDENNVNIQVVDGKISKIETNKDNKSKVIISNIKNKNNLIHDKFLTYQNYFNQDLVLNLNSLFLNSGYEITIAENQQLTIHILNNTKEKNSTIFQKNFIHCMKNSKVCIIEEYSSKILSNTNSVNFLNIDEKAHLNHYIIQRNAKKSSLQLTSYANCKKNSQYKQSTINIANSSIRNHHYANLLGENVLADLDGIFFASTDQIIDNKTHINHNFPNSESNQCYKGILTGNARASYLSKTYVDKIAQKTEAYQLSKGILLSNESSFYSKPELKIFADDVKCSHGSTIGPIDQDLLFYLRSRGLNKKQSISLLIKSFFNNIVSNYDQKDVLDKFNYYSNIWLKQNNI